MPAFDDDLPLDEVDFSVYLPRLRARGTTRDEVLSSLRTNLRLRAITFGVTETPALHRDAEALVEAGFAGLERTAADPAADLSPAERRGAEAVVRLTERPALVVRDDSFPIPPERWRRLDMPHRSEIEAQIRQVGRIDVAVGSDRTMVGTGFVVSEDLVMTNTHVVEAFADPAPDGSRWALKAGVEVSIDFKAEHDLPQRRAFRIKDVVLAHDLFATERLKSLDLALLRVERRSFDPPDLPLPPPVALSKVAPSADDDRDLYLVGYPWTDNEGVTPAEVMAEIFGGIFKVKRLQPGEHRADFEDYLAFSHDCATLGGNSGSGVVDLQTGKVVGLHFRGLYKRANYALQLWRLQQPLAAWGLNFTD